jgi:hypothetical protein
MTTNARFESLSHADQIRALADGGAWRAPAVDSPGVPPAELVAQQFREQAARLAAVISVDGVDGPRFPAFAGLDLSLTATGVAAVRPLGLVPSLDKITTDPADYRSGRDPKTDKPVATFQDRLNRLEDILARAEDAIPPGSLVFLEAPSYGSAGSGTFDRSGLWWLAYQRLTALSCRVVPVPPTCRALYATGKGNAGKDAVIAAVTRRYPDLDVRDNNVADAVVLMAMAARAAGQPMEDSLPAGNLKAMDKLEGI